MHSPTVRKKRFIPQNEMAHHPLLHLVNKRMVRP